MANVDTPNSATTLNGLHQLTDKEKILFSEKYIRQVDYNEKTGNFLFRGSAPIVGQDFQYDSLVGFLRSMAAPSLPTDFKLLDISLLWQFIPDDFEPLQTEKAYWKANTDKGWFLNEPIFGSLFSPPANATERKLEADMGGVLLYDRLDDHVDGIKALLDNSGDNAKGNNIVVYIHCEAGKDRTGEVIAAYEMKYMGRSYEAVMEESRAIAGRDISALNQNAIKWYAYRLRDEENISTIGSID